MFGNAVFQWVPDHPAVLARLLKALPQGGVLAVQMPDNTSEPALALMRDVAERGPYAGHPGLEHATRGALPTPGDYYNLLRPLASHLDVWHIVYNHVMAGPQAIVEWFKGSALRPFLDALDAAVARGFPDRLHRAHRQRLSGPLRRQGPASLPAPVHCRSTVIVFPAEAFATRAGARERPKPFINPIYELRVLYVIRER